MRGFYIWSHNLNRIKFETVLANKAKYTILQFWQFVLAKQGLNVIGFKLWDHFWNISSFQNFLTPICKDLHILSVSHSNLKKSITLGSSKRKFLGKQTILRWSARKKTHQNRGGGAHVEKLKKDEKWRTLTCTLHRSAPGTIMVCTPPMSLNGPPRLNHVRPKVWSVAFKAWTEMKLRTRALHVQCAPGSAIYPVPWCPSRNIPVHRVWCR